MITNFRTLEFDSNLFGYKVGAFDIENSNETEIEAIKTEVINNKFRLIYIYPKDKKSETFIESIGAAKVDEKCYYKKKELVFTEDLPSAIKSYPYDYCTEKMLQLVLQSGQYSRFKTDTNFTISEYDKLYKVWIGRSIKKEIATDVIIYDENDIIGFIIYQLKVNICHLTLIAVDNNYRGLKIGKTLCQELENRCLKSGINDIEVYTQGLNSIARSFYEYNGFQLISTEKIFHLWI